MTGPKDAAAAPFGLAAAPSFDAPEGTYVENSLLVPFSELPPSGAAPSINANIANFSSEASPASASTPASTITLTAFPAASPSHPSPAISSLGNFVGPGSASSVSTQGSNASLGAQTSGPSALGLSGTTFALAFTAPAIQTAMQSTILPLAWRKDVGQTVEPSISTCDIRWSGTATDPFTPEVGVGMESLAGGQTDSSADSSAGGSRGNPRGRVGERNDVEALALANPLIEAALIAQGIDAPASRTTGGLGGLLGLSALASYGFLPAFDDALNLERQLSLLSVRSKRGLSLTFKPAKNAPKPKNAVRASNSSFFIKTQIHPEIKDILAHMEKSWDPANPVDPMAFTQRGRTLLWLQDTTSRREPLARYLFVSPPSAHDVNQLTRSPTVLDVVIGFPTGDIVWLDAIGMRYSRFNKGGIVTESGVTQIRWLPSAGNDGIFISAHADGTMIVWDRDREDCEVNKGWTPRLWTLTSKHGRLSKGQGQLEQDSVAMAIATNFRAASPSAQMDVRTEDDAMEMLEAEQTTSQLLSDVRAPLDSRQNSNRSSLTSNGTRRATSRPTSPAKGASRRNVGPIEWDPKRSIIISRPGMLVDAETTEGGSGDPPYSTLSPADVPPSALGTGLAGRARRKEQSLSLGQCAVDQDPSNTQLGWTKNPVSHWRVSTRKIHNFAISPDLGCVAIVADDGLLKIVDLTTEKLMATHASYFGPFLSVAWSADGRFLITTGCDDLVSIYHPRDSGSGLGIGSESRLVARCVGHSSWVKNAAFDPYRWREGDRTYRFGSVGEDGRVLLWDFSSASLARPKHTTSMRRASGLGFGSNPPTTIGGTLLDCHRRDHQHSPSRGRSTRDGGNVTTRLHNGDEGDAIYQPAPSRQSIAQLNPIASYQASTLAGILSIRFRPSGILLFHSNGIMQTFRRPMVKVLQLDDEDDLDDEVGGDGAGVSNASQGSEAVREKRRRKLLSTTFSRGIRWVGGSSNQQQMQPQTPWYAPQHNKEVREELGET